MDPDHFQKLWTFGRPLGKDFFQLKSLGRFFVGLEAFPPETEKNIMRATRACSPTGLTQQVATFRVNDQSMISPQSFQLLHPLP